MPSPDTLRDTSHTSHAAYRPSTYAGEQLWDRTTQPSIILTVVFLVATALYRVCGPTLGFDLALNALGLLLWDTLVFLVPGPLLNSLDNWLNPPLFPRPMLESQPSTHASKSETMQRVLGMDRSAGMMATVFKARSRALSATGNALGFRLDHERPAGLGNRDNSCYQNSILQGLSALQSLPDYLSACLRNVEAEGSDKHVAQTLRTLISDLNDKGNNGKTLWTPSVLKSMSTWTQQDAQEYYSKILDDIDKGVSKALKAAERHPGFESDSIKDETTSSQHSDDSGYQSQSSLSKISDAKELQNPLEGLLAQRVSCVQCGYTEGLSMIPFNCLTLSLGLDKNQHDVYEMLDSYSHLESIEGVECPKCTLLMAQRVLTKLVDRMRDAGTSEAQMAEPLRRLSAVQEALEEDDFDDKTITEKCKVTSQSKVSTTKTKQIVIARPPQSLAIHMQRSVFDPQTFDMMKNSAPVNFPMTLDLGPWCLGSATLEPELESEKAGVKGDGEEHWVLDPVTSMIAGDLKPSRLTGPIYELRAAVTHSGRHENGHYVCYRKHPRNASTPAASSEKEASPAPDQPIGSADDERGPDAEAEVEALGTGLDAGSDRDWWRLSDHNVSRVDPETVLSLSPGVFMLFYDCIDSSMVLQSEDEEMHDAVEEEAPIAAPEATADLQNNIAGVAIDRPGSADGHSPASDATKKGTEVTANNGNRVVS